MDVLKSIPQAFFDFIARILPGAVAIALLEVVMPGSWKNALTILSAGLLTSQNAFPFVALLVTGASYTLGQLLSPLGKLVDKVTQFVARGVRRLTTTKAEWPLPNEEDWKRYDWLRVNAPVPGSYVVKIRAEYTMYNSLAAAFVLSAASSIFAEVSVIGMIGMFTAGVLMAWRGWDVQKTFRLSTQKLYDAVPKPTASPTGDVGAA